METFLKQTYIGSYCKNRKLKIFIYYKKDNAVALFFVAVLYQTLQGCNTYPNEEEAFHLVCYAYLTDISGPTRHVSDQKAIQDVTRCAMNMHLSEQNR